ncbi:hypothetical protein L211DRAFT_573224 [Terfezia boudieri ATCC MYA-4762]|uniref:RING-type domain-containing protein n=1 Tax=Terfezia boudieri ATCC MYA-4762 TaxID=1051890 RepID=A0A3N4LB48_9PEZI|nr:hypothetical protein L211DRAFT_573224 [Terfezia boudieri ATCC MYA-4762]
MDTGVPRQCNTLTYHHPLIAFAMIMAIITMQAKDTEAGTSIEQIGPARWPSTMDPYHQHSGHVLLHEWSTLHMKIDLLNTRNPLIINSDIYFNGTLHHYTSDRPYYSNSNDSSTIALLSCDDDSAKENFLHAARQRPRAIILYTGEGNCCIFQSTSWQSTDPDQLLIFTFTNMKAIHTSNLLRYAITTGTNVSVEYWANFDESAPPPTISIQPSKMDSPKSSAMLIVYAFVTLIAAVFLAMIFCLTVKAYKRRGGEPIQNVRVHPRQSRARGIGKAALDALPVVKFGSKPLETTPKDVEMQNGAPSLDTGGSMMELHSEAGEQVRAAPLSQEREHHMGATTAIVMANPPTGSTLAGAPARGVEAPTAAEPDLNQVRCPVCLEDFEEDQEVRVLPCSHSFHIDCIDPWLLNVSGSCPLCRIDLRSPEQREHGRLANILPPPPPAVTTGPHNSSIRTRRLQALLDVAWRNSSREERLAALRAVRDETEGGHSGRAPRSRRPELGVSRLRRVVFGSDSNGAGGRRPSLRAETSSEGLV